MKLTPYARRYFNKPTDGGGGGTPPAAAPKSATPPPTPPAPDPGGDPVSGDDPAKAAALAELDFKEPDIPTFGDGDPAPAPPPEGTPDPKKKDKPDGEPKPKPEPTPDPKKQPDPPAKQMRDRISTLEAENADLKKKLEAPSPKVAELETSITSLKAEKDKLEKDIEAARTELSVHDPENAPDIGRLDGGWNETVTKAAEFFPAARTDINELVSKFLAIKRGPAEKYSESITAFRAELAEKYKDDAPTMQRLIQDGYNFLESRGKLIKDIRDGGQKRTFDARNKNYVDHVKLTNEHLASATKVPDDFTTANPHHPLSFVLNVTTGLDDTGKADHSSYEEKINTYIRFAANGLSPAALVEYEKLPPAEKSARLKDVESKRIGAAQWVRQMAKRAAFYERFLPAMLKDYAKLREAAEKRDGGDPPAPTKGSSGDPVDDSLEVPASVMDGLGKI